MFEKHSTGNILYGKTVTAGSGRVIGLEIISTHCVVKHEEPRGEP